jgi:diacylglycerol kinase family enzyme
MSWSRNERARLVQTANQDPRCRGLVAIGGDGTVSALINEQPLVPISVLPTGTENLFARHFKMPARPEMLSQTVAEGEVVWMDLGLTMQRRFALMAGFGFDAAVVTRHHASRMGPAGLPRPTCRSSYVGPVLHAAWFYPFPTLQARILDPDSSEVLEGTSIFVFNLPRYALGLPFVPQAREDDGLLDLLVFRKPGAFQALRYLWLVWRKLHLKTEGVEHRQVRQVEISSTSTVPVQLDGDPAGMLSGTPWRVQVMPRALAVRVRQSAFLASAG